MKQYKNEVRQIELNFFAKSVELEKTKTIKSFSRGEEEFLVRSKMQMMTMKRKFFVRNDNQRVKV